MKYFDEVAQTRYILLSLFLRSQDVLYGRWTSHIEQRKLIRLDKRVNHTYRLPSRDYQWIIDRGGKLSRQS